SGRCEAISDEFGRRAWIVDHVENPQRRPEFRREDPRILEGRVRRRAEVGRNEDSAEHIFSRCVLSGPRAPSVPAHTRTNSTRVLRNELRDDAEDAEFLTPRRAIFPVLSSPPSQFGDESAVTRMRAPCTVRHVC